MPAHLRFSANISMMFCERPFPERIAAAARAGFDSVECHFPYAFNAREVRALVDEAGLVLNGINTSPGNAGEFGLAAQAGREDDFARALDEALAWGAVAGASTVHCMSGVVAPEDRARAQDVFLRNMERASDTARGSGMTLLIEPINPYDRAGYFVSRSDEVAGLLGLLGRDNVKMMFDFYHVQIAEGDLLRRVERHWPLIGHVQFASVPERAEPDMGEIAYGAIFAALARLGWGGYVAAEYRPRGITEEGLGWLAQARL
ncbi:MAG: hypothetical protein JWN93_1388 [Hyphomicrobiales bacterium]|jgi:hydroxypyruvate isomerase|nr:hypothetical protein [Hyphomicrobiales bacterium]